VSYEVLMSEAEMPDDLMLAAVDEKANRKRRSYSVEWKRRVVLKTLLPGASVSRVAQAHGVNTNQVFSWRRLHERGLLAGREQSGTRFLPVAISDPTPLPASAAMRNASSGIIHIELPKARLRIEGGVDPASLRIALECLLG
jgi:transposase